MHQLLVPVAGVDASAAAADLPLVAGRPWVEAMVEPLAALADARVTFLLPRSCQRAHRLADMLRLLAPAAEVIVHPDGIRGPACALLYAAESMTFEELAIVPGNQLYRGDLDALLGALSASPWQVTAVAFQSLHPRWPHVRQGAGGEIVEASRHSLLSRQALAGICHFRHGVDLLRGAEEAISIGADGEESLELSHILNQLILAGLPVGAREVDPRDIVPLVTAEDFQQASLAGASC